MNIFILEGDINNSLDGLRSHLVYEICQNVDNVIVIGGKGRAANLGSNKKGLNSNIHYINLKFNTFNPILILVAILRLLYLVFIYRPKQVVSFNIRPTIIWGFCNHILKVNSTCTVTGTITYRHQNFLKTKYKLILDFCLKGFRNVVFQNKFDLELFEFVGNKENQNRILIEGSGVDIEYFKHSDFVTKEWDFVFVGRLLKQKGVIEFLNASKNLLLKFPHLRFALLGPFYPDSKNDSFISANDISAFLEDDRIKYLGVSNDVRDLLYKAKTLVLPSYGEGMSNILLEAASMSLPLVASDVPGCREIVIDGINGFLCTPMDTLDLEKKMALLVELPEVKKNQLGVNSRKIIADRFSKKHIVSQYINLLGLVKSK